MPPPLDSGIRCAMLSAMRYLTLVLALLFPAPVLSEAGPFLVPGGEYHAAAPPDWDGTSPLPVAIFFHGYGQTGEMVMNNKRLTGPFADKGVLLVAPNGLNKSWSHNGSPSQRRDESAFVDSILEDVTARFPVDEKRIWASGFSQGGSMAWDAACYRGKRFTAFFPIAGAFWRPHPATCEAGPINLFHTHGTGDTVVPMTGRPIREVFHQGDVLKGMELWREVDGCETEPDTVEADGDLRCESWTSCRSGKKLRLCLHPGGHVIPKGLLADAIDWANRVSRK